ncbi:MAG: hypothetical protein WBP44_10495 [Gammaproteobacteria bacterium]|jgi:hypothetical protein
MDRRLYFLLPDRAHALRVVDELNKSGISPAQIHALGDRRTRLDGLPTSTLRQARDSANLVEKLLWNANLVSFAVALCVFIALILTLNWNWWLLLPVVIMVANFFAGLGFTSLPNTHLGEFQDALTHGEILLMVDVAETEVAKVEQQVRHQHPEATIGGVGWGAAALGL